LTWVAIESFGKEGGREGGREEEEEGAPCFLQYTSGSTSEPKGGEGGREGGREGGEGRG